jgi:hypothetical protein
VKWIISLPDGDRLQEMHWSDFKECAGGIWYPMNIQMYLRDVEAPVVFRIEEIDTSPLSKQDFEFTFPPFTHVTDHILGTSYLTTPTIEQSGLEDALAEAPVSSEEKEEVLDRYLASSRATHSRGSDVNDAAAVPLSRAALRDRSYRVAYGTIVLVCVLAGTVAIYVFRRRKRA